MDNNNNINDKIVDLILDSIHELRETTNNSIRELNTNTCKRFDDIEKKIDKGFGETVSLKDCANNQSNLRQNISKENKEQKEKKKAWRIQYLIGASGIGGLVASILTKIFD